MDWVLVVSVAVSVVGLLQWLKGIFTAQPWVWAVASAVGAVGLAAAFFYLPAFVQIGVVALALSQLAYENIIQLVKKKIESL